MLYEFIARHQEDIVARTREWVRGRAWPSIASREIEHGVPLFLTQLSEMLRPNGEARPSSTDAIGSAAARHGAELLAAGFDVAQVVHDYGDICQAVTEIALEHHAAVTVEEFQTLNRCLDLAIAEAVAEHTRLTAQRRSAEEVERLGQAAHEIRDLLNSALLAFHALKRGEVAVNGSTGAVLGRSLTSLRDFVDRTLSEVRLAAKTHRCERVSVTTLVDEVAATGALQSESRGIGFSVGAVNPALAVDADPQLLTSAVMNLLHNAFKYTRPGGTVRLNAHDEGERLLVVIEDECGGIAEGTVDLFEPFGERRGSDRSGLGLGLFMARRAVRADRGDIRVRSVPGKGCVFTVELPLAAIEQEVRCAR